MSLDLNMSPLLGKSHIVYKGNIIQSDTYHRLTLIFYHLLQRYQGADKNTRTVLHEDFSELRNNYLC